jgi:hypothetical protein
MIFNFLKGIDLKSDVIVSMKTHGARINTTHLALGLLLRQKKRPKKIILYVSKKEFPNGESDLTYRLLELRKHGIEIIFLDCDNGPYDKLVHTYRKYRNDRIVTVDDDLIYPNWFLDRLLAKASTMSDNIVCYRARHIRKIAPNRFAPYTGWEFATVNTPPAHIFPTNGAGTLFPAGSLHEDVFDLDTAHRLCPLADDIWYKVMSLRKGTQCCMVARESTMFEEIPGTKKDGLWINHNKHTNDKKLSEIFAHYDLFKMIP